MKNLPQILPEKSRRRRCFSLRAWNAPWDKHSWLKGKKIPSAPLKMFKATRQEIIFVAIWDVVPGICRSLHEACAQEFPGSSALIQLLWHFPFPTMQVLTSQNKPSDHLAGWNFVEKALDSRSQSTFFGMAGSGGWRGQLLALREWLQV